MPTETVQLAETIRTRWCEVLSVTDAGPYDDFFLSGGHSLFAVRLTAVLREDLGVRVPVAAIFETRTLGAFTDRVASFVREQAPADG